MRTLPIAIACLSLLTLGCRAAMNNNITLLERDLRLQEDEIYHLQACLEDAQAAREATIRENEALKQELTEAPGIGGGASAAPDADLTPPAVDLPGSRSPARSREVPDLQPPSIELPEPSDAPQVELPPAGDGAAVSQAPPTQLVINSRLTGGMDRDGHDGDEGILVVFEPRDAAGKLVKWPGKVSVVAMDPALEGEASRVARWDFSSDEVTNHYMSTVFGRGLQFELPWPSNPPASRDLVVFVRFTTDDGKKLTAEAKIVVSLPDGAAPGQDRQTKRPSSEQANRKSAPQSRRKDKAPPSDAPRTATRSDRPQWTPYR
ncbi:MAG: hypothetical protein WD845_04230 [Pirellulales bacterium]